MKASFILAYLGMGPVEALKNNIGFSRFADGHHFNIDLIDFNDSGERTLAYFALKFGKVIGSSNVIDLFFNLTIYPLSQTANMDLC